MSQEESISQSIATAATKASPAVAATLADKVLGLTLNDWVAIATLAYLALQAFFLIKDRMKKRAKK